MTRLRFVELTPDAGTLILADESGERYELAADAQLRKALVRAPRKGADHAPVSLSPKDIQTRIRQGATIHEIAIETGLPAERVESFATPVLAEREFAAATARALPAADPTLNRDALRRVFGEDPVSLEAMVQYRAEQIGLDPESLAWDAWKRTDALWELQMTFEVVDSSLLEREELSEDDYSARWIYNPLRRSVTNSNTWARLLSELEAIEQAEPRLSALPSPSAEDEQKGEEPAQEQQSTSEAAPSASEESAPQGALAQQKAAESGARVQSLSERRDQKRQADPSRDEAPESEPAPASDAEEDSEEITARVAPKKRSVKDRSSRSRVPSWDQIYFGSQTEKD